MPASFVVEHFDQTITELSRRLPNEVDGAIPIPLALSSGRPGLGGGLRYAAKEAATCAVGLWAAYRSAGPGPNGLPRGESCLTTDSQNHAGVWPLGTIAPDSVTSLLRPRWSNLAADSSGLRHHRRRGHSLRRDCPSG